MSEGRKLSGCTGVLCLVVSLGLSLGALPAGADHLGEAHVTFAQLTFQSPLILPTDTASWGGEMGRSKGLAGMEAPPDLAPWLFHGQAPSVERDSRYSFTGVWTHFGQVDRFASSIQDKIPALAKVQAELKTPCGQISPSMPPVPDLPDPERVGKAPAAEKGVGNIWQAVANPGSKQDATAQHAALTGKLMFNKNCQQFVSGSKDTGRRFVVGAPGTVAIAKTANTLVVKVGRAYVFNGSSATDLDVESGRMSIILPPGASGIVDTAANGLTQWVALTDSPRRQTRVVDICTPSLELARVDSGGMVTVAQEDAVVEDLISLHGIDETVDSVKRKEGYLLVLGRFSIRQALEKDATFTASPFSSDPALKEEKTRLIAASQSSAPAPPLPGGVVTHETGQAQGEGEPAAGRSQAKFMPTRGARYGTLSDNELMIADGAVLVKGGREPVIVSAELNHRKMMTEIKDGALVMVSALDGRVTALNLTDGGGSSCVIYMSGGAGEKTRTLSLITGEVAELYINDGMEPASTVLAYRTVEKKALAGGLGILLAKFDYLAAMKRFNLSFALPSQDLSRILKTMAATAFMQYGRR